MNNKKIYAVILSHNCEHMIDRTISRIPHSSFAKIIVSDDGSTDNSVSKYRSLGYTVVNSNNKGYGANIKNALVAAFDDGADYILEIHGDGAQFDPKAISKASSLIENDTDLILGSRFIEKGRALKLGMPLPRYIANRALSFIDRIILSKNLSEFHTGFRVYSRKFKDIDQSKFSNDYLFSFQIIAYAIANDYKVDEIPVECDYNSEHTSHGYLGASKYAITHFFVLIWYVLFKYLRVRRSIFK
tara:strand:+ start:76803 stop:77534 length:732 start_codon:yes stop_codon:yes gene_type:complete